jgi:putative protein kinase ArgK-like GTPase of G3E family
MTHIMTKALLASLAMSVSAFFVTTSSASEAKPVGFPPFVQTEAQEIDFIANCIAVFEDYEKTTAETDSAKAYAQNIQAKWMRELVMRVSDEKARKKMVKKKRKAIKRAAKKKPQTSGLLADMPDISAMKAQTQCQFPESDLRGAG